MIDSASGVFADAAKTAASPTPAPSSSGMPSARASTLPSVAPTKNSGVTSPPRKPAPSVTAVNSSFERERVGRQARVAEGAHDRRHAEPEIVAGPDELPESDHDQPAQEHAQRQPRDQRFAALLDAVRSAR